MIVQIFSKDILEILTIFSISPGSKFSRKELKERTKLNNVNLDKAINILQNSNLITQEKRLLTINFDTSKPIINLVSDQYKVLRELPLDVYFSIIQVIFFLSKLKNVGAYLFGSYAKLIFKEKSDIDIAVVSDNINSKDKKDLNNLTQKLGLRYEKKIEIHYFERNFYKNKNDPLVKEILKNGIKLI